MRAAVGPTLASRALSPASRGSRVARDAAPQPPRGNRKKSGGRRARGRKPREQEFVEDAGRREREFGEAMSRVTARNAPGSVDEEGAGEMNPGAGASFEEKLAAVRREGAAKKAESGTGTSGGAFDMNAKVDFGGAAPSGPMANYMDQESGARESDDDEDGNQTLVRVVSFLAACALVVVFIPSDLTFNAPAGRKIDGLSEKVKEEVQAQADAVVESLNSAPEDVDKLRQAAQSYLALDDYPKALPFLERLVAIDPTNEENVSALAETWIADGQPARAVDAFRVVIDAEVLDKDGSTRAPSSSFLRGYLDALGKTGRNGLALEYAKTFAKKGWVDDVDGALLEARVYSSWKGHGKDAEKAYDSVVADHPSDFRGYLAQGVFYRTVGKPDAAENAFRKAKSLAPADTAGVVNQVIAASKSSK